VSFSLLAIACASCGGGTGQGRGAKAGGEAAEGESGNHEGGGADQEEAEVDPRTAACADGTCTPCGAGICPGGFYCDEKAPGGAACSWLPECAAKATCSCVTGVLGSGCSCEERDGGVFVRCD
jgi:hypothetical protein